MDANVIVSSMAVVGIDWHAYLSMLANGLLPDLVKITTEVVIIPLLGMGARWAAHELAQRHFKFLVKWAGQTITRGTEQWAEKRLALVVEAARKVWWLKWLNEEDLKRYIEAAVAEWNKEFVGALGMKP